MAIYVNFLQNGLVYISGASTAKGHEKWVEASSFYAPLPRQTPGTAPNDGDGDKPPPRGELVITKATDVASPRLLMAFHDATSMTVTIDLPSEKGALTFTAGDAAIAAMTLSTAGDAPQESIAISYATLAAGYVDGPDASDQIPAQYRVKWGPDLPRSAGPQYEVSAE